METLAFFELIESKVTAPRRRARGSTRQNKSKLSALSQAIRWRYKIISNGGPMFRKIARQRDAIDIVLGSAMQLLATFACDFAMQKSLAPVGRRLVLGFSVAIGTIGKTWARNSSKNILISRVARTLVPHFQWAFSSPTSFPLTIQTLAKQNTSFIVNRSRAGRFASFSRNSNYLSGNVSDATGR